VSETTDPTLRGAVDLGWELMKRYYPTAVPPMIFLWQARNGWEGGHSVTVEPHDAKQVLVKANTYEQLRLLAPMSLN